MSATTGQLIALGNDPFFRQRVRVLVLQMCAQIDVEDPQTDSHAARVAFAFRLIANPGLADEMAPVLATRTNLLNSAITYDFDHRAVVTDATDAAILSQLATDWNFFAGIA